MIRCCNICITLNRKEPTFCADSCLALLDDVDLFLLTAFLTRFAFGLNDIEGIALKQGRVGQGQMGLS